MPFPETYFKAKIMMPSFKTIFSTKTLLRVIAVLMTAVAMKALSLHYDFSWAAAMTAN